MLRSRYLIYILALFYFARLSNFAEVCNWFIVYFYPVLCKQKWLYKGTAEKLPYCSNNLQERIAEVTFALEKSQKAELRIAPTY